MSRKPSRIGTFRQLEILMAVSEYGGIAKAAEQLHLTQPSASAQLKALSDSIGMPLYNIVGRKVQLTDAGRATVQAAKEVFASMGRLDMQLSELQGLQAGQLNIGVVSTAEYFVPHLLGVFCRRYPGINVEMTVANRSSLIERLQENLDDLYFFSHPPDQQNLEFSPFMPNSLVVVAPKRHPLAMSNTLKWQDIADNKFLLREPGSGSRLTIEQHLVNMGYGLPESMTMASNEAIKHGVMAGLGLAILSTHTLNAADREDLCVMTVEGFPIEQDWYLVSRKDSVRSVVAASFYDFMLTEAQPLMKDGMQYWDEHHRPKLPKET